MAWPKLRKSRGTEPEGIAESTPPLAPALEQRLKRLVRKLDQLPAKDQLRIRQAMELNEKQRTAGLELYALCRNVVDTLNSMLEHLQLDLTPDEFNPEMLESPSGLLFQINASGRIVQLVLQPKEASVSTEHFRIPYILRGSIRWFNQESLERQEIQENQIFWCLDRTGGAWRFYDPRGRKVGPVDLDYLLETIDQLL